MKLKQLAAAMIVAAAAPSFAAIANNASGNGELFLVVVDSVAKVSYTKDLGLLQDDFFVNAQSEAGYSASFSLAGDSYFSTFQAASSTANLKWAVLALETTGGVAVDKQRLFTTVQAGQEAQISALTNQKFTNGTGAAQAGTFFNAINTTGSHGTVGVALDFAINGSSVNYDTDPGNAYFGSVAGLTPTLNGNTTFNSTNAVGVASNFYYLTRSGGNQLDSVKQDLFDNSAATGQFNLQDTAGAYTLTYSIAAAVPEPETYALMLAGLVAVGFVARRRAAAR